MSQPAGASAVGVDIVTGASLLAVRARVRAAAASIGLGVVAQTKLVTAASELARNILRYAGQGTMLVELASSAGRVGVRVRFEDEGPGIVDVDRALEDGYSTSGGLGMGLPGARRLVDDFVLETAPGKGTVVEITGWAR
jgi:serine/threonine-protein kinase RsbT